MKRNDTKTQDKVFLLEEKSLFFSLTFLVLFEFFIICIICRVWISQVFQKKSQEIELVL